jgi:hypothetical protein
MSLSSPPPKGTTKATVKPIMSLSSPPPKGTTKATVKSIVRTSVSGATKAATTTLTEENRFECNIVINEIYASKGTEIKNMFIELKRICGSSREIPKAASLDGYMILIVEIHNDLRIVFSADLSGQKLFSKTEQVDGKEVANYYHITATNLVPQAGLRISLDKQVTHVAFPDIYESIPSESKIPRAVILLQFDKPYRNVMQWLPPVPFYDDVNKQQKFRYQILDGSLANSVRHHIRDMFVYSTECLPNHAALLKTIYKDFPNDCFDYFYSIDRSQSASLDISYSRCGTGNVRFRSAMFRDAINTPGSQNRCPSLKNDKSFRPPFKFRGTALQSTAQKMILNVWHSVQVAATDPSFLDGPPKETAAKMLGITERTITRINERWRKNAIMTPGKNRKRICPAQAMIDSFDQDKIRTIISDYYKKGKPPLLEHIYNDFLLCKAASNSVQEALFERHGDLVSPPDPDFSISKATFSIVLRKMGFKYGRIDTRAIVLQKPDIVSWRGRYLKRLKKNEAATGPNKLNVIYLDEVCYEGFQQIIGNLLIIYSFCLLRRGLIQTFGLRKPGFLVHHQHLQRWQLTHTLLLSKLGVGED